VLPFGALSYRKVRSSLLIWDLLVSQLSPSVLVRSARGDSAPTLGSYEIKAARSGEKEGTALLRLFKIDEHSSSAPSATVASGHQLCHVPHVSGHDQIRCAELGDGVHVRLAPTSSCRCSSTGRQGVINCEKSGTSSVCVCGVGGCDTR
jgi:hypothetical protein